MGVGEEASKTAQTVVEALKSTPLVLALVIFNILYMALTGWAVHEGGNRWERLLSLAYEHCSHHQQAKGQQP